MRKGAFVAGHSAAFAGKIIYPQCRKAVWTPSDWDPSLAERSSELPAARLVLEYIYGYGGARARATRAPLAGSQGGGGCAAGGSPPSLGAALLPSFLSSRAHRALLFSSSEIKLVALH